MIGFESRLETDDEKATKVSGFGEERLGEAFIPEGELLDMNWKEIGTAVVEPRDREFRELAYKAATICRRRFCVYEAVLISKLDREAAGDAGICFTANAIYCWTEGDTFGYRIFYRDIEEVDYSPDGVLLTVAGESAKEMRKCTDSDSSKPGGDSPSPGGDSPSPGGAQTAPADDAAAPLKIIRTLYCAGDADSTAGPDRMMVTRNMYNFISDIVDYGKTK